jgi:hypothetical protein
MTCLKYPVYLHGIITMTYLKPTFVWQHYVHHLEEISSVKWLNYHYIYFEKLRRKRMVEEPSHVKELSPNQLSKKAISIREQRRSISEQKVY